MRSIHAGAVLMAAALFTASVPASAAGEHSYARFRVLTDSGERIEGRDARFTPEGLTAKKNDGTPFTLPRERIHALDFSKGTNAGKGAALGAASGLLTGLLAVVQVKADETRELKEGAAVGVTAGLTVAGGLIGLAIGSSSQRWENVPLQSAGVPFSDRVCYVHVMTVSF